MEKIDIHGKPRALRKLFSRIPGYPYRAGLSEHFEANTAFLSTKWRKSGKTIRTPPGYAKKGDVVYVASLYENPDGFKNALKNFEVEIQIEKKHVKACAFSMDDSEEKVETYKTIVRTQVEREVEKHHYVKPLMDEKEIDFIGKSLPIMRFEIVEEVLK